jgi:hypothetical protein
MSGKPSLTQNAVKPEIVSIPTAGARKMAWILLRAENAITAILYPAAETIIAYAKKLRAARPPAVKSTTAIHGKNTIVITTYNRRSRCKKSLASDLVNGISLKLCQRVACRRFSSVDAEEGSAHPIADEMLN